MSNAINKHPRLTDSPADKTFSRPSRVPFELFDFAECDSVGLRVEVHLFGKFAIKFWNDWPIDM